MTIAELIIHLQLMPADHEVIVFRETVDPSNIEQFRYGIYRTSGINNLKPAICIKGFTGLDTLILTFGDKK